MNSNGWKVVLERIRISGISGESCPEYDKLAEYLADVDKARTILQQHGYGHSGMKLSEIAELVAPF